MRAPGFWRADGVVPRLLSPLGALYGAVAARRLRGDPPRAVLPTIVVGGLTAGGDGKTPTAIALAELLAAQGERPALLTRGYGRAQDRPAFGMVPPYLPFTGRSAVEDRRVGRPNELLPHPALLRRATLPVKGRDSLAPSVVAEPFAVDLARHDADSAGDEALLLARHALTIVGADRAASAELAHMLGATVLVLDDGLHSRRLAPNLSLLIVDAAHGAGNGRCIPAGPLRAPLDAQFAAADALVVVGEGAAGRELASRCKKRVFDARIVPDPEIAGRLRGARVVAFAGIGRPEKFFESMRMIGAEVVATRGFPDHHRFSAKDAADLAALQRRHGARLVTTEKDAMRLAGSALPFEFLPIRLAFAEADAVSAALEAALQCARVNRAS
ncbi:tetraacyldisaccharide 4'-kinase [Methylocystis sp. S23]